MEESAVRESYEEAGVLGTLGTKLSEIQYETRKSRKRRLELEEMLKRQKDVPESEFSSGASDAASEEEPLVERANKGRDDCSPTVAPPPSPKVQLSDDVVNRIRASRNTNMGWDETSSAASDTSANYSLVRMTLFPLYVTEVMDDWPESGRFRKAMEIDDAIEMMKSRPEFHAVLKEVKEKGVHHAKKAVQ
jgi:diphosphoinositol-polyphosphate diphosphatase